MASSSSSHPLRVAADVGTSTATPVRQSSIGSCPAYDARHRAGLLRQPSRLRVPIPRSLPQRPSVADRPRLQEPGGPGEYGRLQTKAGAGLGFGGQDLFSRRDAAVHNLEMGLRRAGSLSVSGEMSPSRQLPYARDFSHRIGGQSLLLSPLFQSSSGFPYTPAT